MKKEYFIKNGYNDENVFAYLYMEFNDYDEMYMRNALQKAELKDIKDINVQFMKNIIDHYGFDAVVERMKTDIAQNGSFNYDFSAEREDETYPLEQAIIDTFADAIKDDIVIDEESYEPVDTEGHIVDGYAQYKGERFEFTDVIENNSPSYKITAAITYIERKLNASDMERKLETYENDGSVGYSLTRYCDNTKTAYSKAVMITKSNSDVTVPYVYAVSDGDISEKALSSDDVRAMEYDARKNLITEISKSDLPESKWAQSVLAVNDELEQLVNKVDDHTQIMDKVEYTSPDGYEMLLELCRNSPQENFSFIMCEDDNIGCAYDLLELAGNVVNHEGNERSIEKSKRKLNEFYDEKIVPCISKSSKELTDEDRENLQYYSDWHKDLYGVRPKLTFGKSSRESEERE